jgi:nicotinic acetylcholine receptor
MKEQNLSSFSTWWASWVSMILLIFSTWPSDVLGGPHERRLLNDLLEHYNTLERPVYNESEPLQLLFGLTLQQIIDVDEKNQILTTNIWLNLVSLVGC